MSVFHENMLIGASGQVAAGGISRSLRFNSADSAYLSRTPASAGNRKTWTWAGWVKRSGTGAVLDHIFLGSLVTDAEGIRFNSSDKIQFYLNGGSFAANLITTQVFRDFSAWYHIVVAVDTTQATASNRVKLYINGSQITAFDTSTYPSQNYDCPAINTTAVHWIGANIAGPFYSNFYLADCYLIDGSALTPSSFTEVSATTGQLIPKQYTGSFGTNGFWLKFSDNSAATATTLGKDYSGNSNNWTPNNLSVTAGAGNDSLVDTPSSAGTDTGLGGQVTGNYCTLNPLAKGGDIQAPTNGNLQVTSSGSGYGLILGTIGMSSGKWYWEVTTTSANCATGIATNQANLASYGGADAYSWVWASYSGGSNKRNNGSQSSYGSILANGDVVGIAFDADNGTLTFYKNNVSQGAAYTGLVAGTYLPVLGDETASANIDLTVNFGQRPWAYQAPANHRPLVDTLLPSPVVAKPNTVFDVITYTGNGSTRTLPDSNSTPTSLAFGPNLLWFKSRSVVDSAPLFDSVRGTNKAVFSTGTTAEYTPPLNNGVTAFNSNGVNIGGYENINANNVTFVAWCWDAGEGDAVTNTAGSITTSLRASASSGFSVISYTGTGSAGASIGHGLGVAPAFALFKNRSTSSDWQVYHVSLGNAQSILLQSTAAAGSSSAFNSTSPTSTVITLGAGTSLNNNGSNHICYAWAPVAGYSSFGSYVGNGTSGDGVFVYTGFRVRWLLIKQSSAAGEQWFLLDSARSPYNVAQEYLCPSASFGETSAYGIVDFLSNGFKLRATGSISSFNGSGATYIYCAFAESPLQYARAR